MKKLLAITLMLLLFTPSSEAFSLFGKKCENNCKNALFGYLKNEDEFGIKKDKAEIKEVLAELEKYSNEHNIEGILSLYDKNYLSYDGFDLETMGKILKDTFDNYKDITYKTEIRNITVLADEAIVSAFEKTKGTIRGENTKDATSKYMSKKLDVGYLEGECDYAIYLKKTKDGWKISGDNVVAETNIVKYGAAKDIPMQLVAPIQVKLGEEYCIGLKMNLPKDTKAITSLSNEPIMYPTQDPKEAYRKFPKDDILERVVRQNKKGLNEYAVASIGLTKIEVAQDLSSIRFEMTGLAFLMQRVNFYTEKNPKGESKKEELAEKCSK